MAAIQAQSRLLNIGECRQWSARLLYSAAVLASVRRLGRLDRQPIVELIVSQLGEIVLGPSLILIFSLTWGIILFWDVRGYATRVRRQTEARRFDGALYRKLPSWWLRAFGIWCFVFGIGQFIVLYALTHR